MENENNIIDQSDNNIEVNPFNNYKIDKLDYDTDDENSNKFIRIIYTWTYKINYNYFNLNYFSVCISKNSYFKNKLEEIKYIRNNQNNFNTGNVIKIENNNEIFKLGDEIYIYFIIYYDNVKINIEFYGLFNEKIDEILLLNNIKNKNFGKIGEVIGKNINTINDNDFVVFNKKLYIL